MSLNFKKLGEEATQKFQEDTYKATLDMINQCEMEIAFSNDKQAHSILKELYGEEMIEKKIKGLQNALREKRSLKHFLERYLKNAL